MRDPLIRSRTVIGTVNGDRVTVSPSPPDELHEALASMSPYFCVLRIKNQQNKVIGSANFWLEPDEPGTVYLNWIDLVKSVRGCGYGTAIMRFADEHFRAAGMTRLILKVSANAAEARHIYEKLGFMVIEEPEDQLRGNLILMEKLLNDKEAFE